MRLPRAQHSMRMYMKARKTSSNIWTSLRKRWLGIREEDRRRPVGGFEDFFFAAFDGIRFFDAFADHKIHHREMAFA